jgi:hypothetical protein
VYLGLAAQLLQLGRERRSFIGGHQHANRSLSAVKLLGEARLIVIRKAQAPVMERPHHPANQGPTHDAFEQAEAGTGHGGNQAHKRADPCAFPAGASAGQLFFDLDLLIFDEDAQRPRLDVTVFFLSHRFSASAAFSAASSESKRARTSCLCFLDMVILLEIKSRVWLLGG